MRPSLGFLEKIENGDKTIESRWYLQRSAPWDEISAGDTIYFKNAGEPASVKASVADVRHLARLNPFKIRQLLDEFGSRLGLTKSDSDSYFTEIKNKKFGILIYLQDVKKIRPFDIDKRGFGTMSAWLVIENIDKIKRVKAQTFKQNKLLR
ncbi:hypothetical protein COT78_03880 [Candidatus Berkelbacteria bacterium CG10_big_fil_rev_8_21_14_0_10_43_13]|uniref:ASCH domain-containing protein n=1 Tax=Candidatus Berkelbacteria bacterium CG10_big_fil_rev_8_21_14_0_10_43_13 TaxID=1974514 RepID=A0A2H0W7P0_9BACT|nr:MAG: hypothetical protein COT78_03880 [Candidatus Berkelbacteria bacterium CG10_big_fil_rev_8_21_14_0_10_43_13]